VFGHFLSEKWGKWNFWFMLIGFNLTFGPMHILGMQGMMRRTYTYTEGQGFNFWNLVATIGAFTLGVSVVLFMVNVAISYRRHRANPVDPGPDPWDARSLEWMISSPPPEHNFDEVPIVEEFDEFWHRKYGHDENGRLVRIAKTEDVVQKGDATGVHLPSPSYWPIVLAAGLPLIGYGIIFQLWWCVPGVLLLIAGIYGWVMEPSVNPDEGHDHDDHPTSDGGSDAAGTPELSEPSLDTESSGETEPSGDADLEPAGDGGQTAEPVPANAASTEEAPVG